VIKKVLKAKDVRFKVMHKLILKKIQVDFDWKQNEVSLADFPWIPRK